MEEETDEEGGEGRAVYCAHETQKSAHRPVVTYEYVHLHPRVLTDVRTPVSLHLSLGVCVQRAAPLHVV